MGEEFRQWLPIIIIAVTNIIVIVWQWAKLDKKIGIIDVRMVDRFENLTGQIKEIKDNHLVHLTAEVKCIGDKLTDHLISHNKE